VQPHATRLGARFIAASRDRLPRRCDVIIVARAARRAPRARTPLLARSRSAEVIIVESRNTAKPSAPTLIQSTERLFPRHAKRHAVRGKRRMLAFSDSPGHVLSSVSVARKMTSPVESTRLQHDGLLLVNVSAYRPLSAFKRKKNMISLKPYSGRSDTAIVMLTPNPNFCYFCTNITMRHSRLEISIQANDMSSDFLCFERR